MALPAETVRNLAVQKIIKNTITAGLGDSLLEMYTMGP